VLAYFWKIKILFFLQLNKCNVFSAISKLVNVRRSLAQISFWIGVEFQNVVGHKTYEIFRLKKA
jgi:hypothetical protein